MKNKYIFTLTITSEVAIENDIDLEKRLENHRNCMFQETMDKIYHERHCGFPTLASDIIGVKIDYEEK